MTSGSSSHFAWARGRTRKAARGWVGREKAEERVERGKEGLSRRHEQGVCPPGQCVFFGDWELVLVAWD